MEQLLNFPYEEDINLDTVEQSLREHLPNYAIKRHYWFIVLKKNFLVQAWFAIRKTRDNRQLYYKTKMNIWAWLIVIGLMLFSSIYYFHEMNYLNMAEKVMLSLCCLGAIGIWAVYLIMKIGLSGKIKSALENSLPAHIKNRRDYFFPSQSTVSKWKNDMTPVSVLTLAYCIICVVFQILIFVFNMSMQHEISSMLSKINNFFPILLIVIAMIFVLKKYNQEWNIAKILILVYTVIVTCLNVLYVAGLWNNDNNLIFNIISFANMVVLLIFAILFHQALKNSSSLYFIKVCVIYVVLSILMSVFVNFFLMKIDYLNDYEVFHKYSVIASTGNALIYLLYLYGLAKAFCTLPKHVPQGLNIRI